jgi:hypothetical protein
VSLAHRQERACKRGGVLQLLGVVRISGLVVADSLAFSPMCVVSLTCIQVPSSMSRNSWQPGASLSAMHSTVRGP